MNWTFEVVQAAFAAWLTITVVVWTVQMIKCMIRRVEGDD
jgi:hypothetical protein